MNINWKQKTAAVSLDISVIYMLTFGYMSGVPGHVCMETTTTVYDEARDFGHDNIPKSLSQLVAIFHSRL